MFIFIEITVNLNMSALHRICHGILKMCIKKVQSVNFKRELRTISSARGNTISNTTAYRWLPSTNDSIQRKGGKPHEKFLPAMDALSCHSGVANSEIKCGI